MVPPKQPLPLRVRYAGPYSMDLHIPSTFAPTLLKNVLVWEVPRLALTWLVKRRSGDRKLLDIKGKEFADCAPSYVMSLVHAVVVSSLGLKIMVGLTDELTFVL